VHHSLIYWISALLWFRIRSSLKFQNSQRDCQQIPLLRWTIHPSGSYSLWGIPKLSFHLWCWKQDLAWYKTYSVRLRLRGQNPIYRVHRTVFDSCAQIRKRNSYLRYGTVLGPPGKRLQIVVQNRCQNDVGHRYQIFCTCRSLFFRFSPFHSLYPVHRQSHYPFSH